MTKTIKDWACPCGRKFGCKKSMYNHKNSKDATDACKGNPKEFKKPKMLPHTLNKQTY